MTTKLWQWCAWKLPKQLVYFAAIRLMAHATTGPYNHTIVPDLTVMEALSRWYCKMNEKEWEP